MKEKGIFTISLDFELHWGCFQNMKTINAPEEQYFINTRNAIPQMLINSKLFIFCFKL